MQGEVSRKSRDYIRWVQRSLNQILGLRLKEDGIIGKHSRSAVRSFQSRYQLKVDGIVGPYTEQALITAGANPPPTVGTDKINGARPAHSDVNTPLPTRGSGHYSYQPTSKQFGRPQTIAAVQAIAAAWQQANPQGPRIGIGNISLKGGGLMPPHKSHQKGVDVDIRPVRNDRQEKPVNYQSPGYSHALTQELVNLIRANGVLPVRFILFNDPDVNGVTASPGHDDHLHVRFGDSYIQPEITFEGLSNQKQSATSEQQLIQNALRQGHRNENYLTDIVFSARHPERKGRALQAHERRLRQEWIEIRNRLVRPALAKAVAPSSQPAPPSPSPAKLCDNEGRHFLTTGIFTKSTKFNVQGGQAMNFVLKNLNVLGTTIRITANDNQSKGLVIPPLSTMSVLFTRFGCEPMFWEFAVETESDAFIVQWTLCSTWVPGEPENCR